MRKFVIPVLILLLLIMIRYFSYKNFSYILMNDIEVFKNEYISYRLNNLDGDINNKEDLKDFFYWIKQTSHFQGFKVLDVNNVIVEFDSVNKVAKIYYSMKENVNDWPEAKLSFLDYLMFKSTIVLGCYEQISFDCMKYSSINNTYLSKYLSAFELRKNKKSLLGNEAQVQRFYGVLNKFESNFNERKNNESNTKILWFLYKNDKIEVICNDFFPKEEISLISGDLEQFILKNSKGEFDYAFFALRLK